MSYGIWRPYCEYFYKITAMAGMSTPITLSYQSIE